MDATAWESTEFSHVSWSSLLSLICHPVRSHLPKGKKTQSKTKKKKRIENSVMRKVKLDWSPGLSLTWNNKRTKSLDTEATVWQRHDKCTNYNSCHYNKGLGSFLCQKLLQWSNLCYLECTLASNRRISIWHLRGFCNHSILYYL